MMQLHTKFHMPSFSGSLVITIKLKAMYRFCATTMFYRKACLNESCLFFKVLFPHRISVLYTSVLVLAVAFLITNKFACLTMLVGN
jgi:hypothetical protein